MPIDPRDPARVRAAIRTLRKRECRGVGVRGCYPADRLDLVRRTLLVHRGGRTIEIPVTLQRCAMIALLRALLDAPGIQPWGALSTYRSCEIQRELYERHLAGGPLAAPPGRSWHNVGLAFDLFPRGKGSTYVEADRRALVAHGWRPLGEVDPPHFEYRHHP